MSNTILIETYEAILADAHTRHRKYAKSTAGRAMGQSLNEQDHFEWWLLTSAYQIGLDIGRGKSNK